MKIFLQSAGIAVLCWVLAYLFGSFLSWEVNPGNWTSDMRLFVAVKGSMFGALLVYMNAE